MADKKQDDYGYFGKGIDGYVHYKQAFDESLKNEQTTSKNNRHDTTMKKQSKQHSSNNNDKKSSNYVPIGLILTCFGGFGLIMLIPTLLGHLLTRSVSGADSFGGIFILVVGAILIALL